MKIVVTGGRLYAHYEYVCLILDYLDAEYGIDLLIHGACGWDADDPKRTEKPMNGADALADEWARMRGIPIERVPALWTSLGAKAGPIRNGHMLDRKPDLVVAFRGNKGTHNCVAQAAKRGIPALVTEHLVVSDMPRALAAVGFKAAPVQSKAGDTCKACGRVVGVLDDGAPTTDSLGRCTDCVEVAK